jgi:hypothetical protein
MQPAWTSAHAQAITAQNKLARVGDIREIG